MSEKTEADEIEEELNRLIANTFNSGVLMALDGQETSVYSCHDEQKFMDRIRSIISERDALRAAMQSHRKELRCS